jgi:hypothetical protein
VKLFFASLTLFIFLLTQIDRACFKASKGFCLHFVDVPLSHNPAWETSAPLPPVFDQPFTYLGRGAQSFVFQSQDQQYVFKLYRFPSHMRLFGWLNHPIGYTYSEKRRAIKKHNEERFFLSYNSYFLAYTKLPEETGVVYVHLNPTTHLQKKVRLVDRLGYTYELPLDRLGFVVQKKGTPFMPLFQAAVENHQTETARQMIDGLVDLIVSRCSKGIIDLDNIANDNYGWFEDRAIHLDIGRFTPRENISASEEVLRVTHTLGDYLEKNAPDLLEYYLNKVATSASEV